MTNPLNKKRTIWVYSMGDLHCETIIDTISRTISKFTFER